MSVKSGEKATLVTPMYRTTRPSCLQFYYVVEDTSGLGVDIVRSILDFVYKMGEFDFSVRRSE